MVWKINIEFIANRDSIMRGGFVQVVNLREGSCIISTFATVQV